MVALQEVINIKRIGKIKCVDLEMESPQHNFVCESAVVSNSHAASYGAFAYITAWLKKYYPLEYMNSVMSHNMDDDKKLVQYINDAKKIGIKIEPPLINDSDYEFRIKDDYIIYPFTAIKGCGDKAVNNIIAVRKKGKFKGFKDFYKRVDRRVVNVSVMANMIMAGCFREFDKRHNTFDIMVHLRKEKSVIRSIFCEDCGYRYPVSLSVKKVKEEGIFCPNCGGQECNTEVHNKQFDKTFISNKIFGFLLDTNPLKRYAATISNMKCEPMSAVEDISDSDFLIFPAMVEKVKLHKDKNGNTMAFVDLTDGTYNSSLTIFASDWDRVNAMVKKGACFVVKACKNRGNNFLYNTFKGAKLIKLSA